MRASEAQSAAPAFSKKCRHFFEAAQREMSAAFRAMNAGRQAAETAVRFSLGMMNTIEEMDAAADAVIHSVLVPTLTVGTDGTVTVTGGSYTVTSNVTLTEKKKNSGYTVTYNTNTAAP